MTRDELVELMARAIALSHGGRIVGPGQSNATREIGWRGDGEHLEIYVERHWKEHAHAAEFALTELEKHAVVVPAEPTEAMLRAAYAACDEHGAVLIKSGYRAMIAARPR